MVAAGLSAARFCFGKTPRKKNANKAARLPLLTSTPQRIRLAHVGRAVCALRLGLIRSTPYHLQVEPTAVFFGCCSISRYIHVLATLPVLLLPLDPLFNLSMPVLRRDISARYLVQRTSPLRRPLKHLKVPTPSRVVTNKPIPRVAVLSRPLQHP